MKNIRMIPSVTISLHTFYFAIFAFQLKFRVQILAILPKFNKLTEITIAYNKINDY